LDPRIRNGGFEERLEGTQFLPGWYYERQLSRETDGGAPEGRHYIALRNDLPGRSAHVLQALPIDGRRISSVTLTCWVRFRNVSDVQSSTLFPTAAICFYDENLAMVGSGGIGPFRGSEPWRRLSRLIPVPPAAREAILQLGLFGAAGELYFDDVRMEISLRSMLPGSVR
jgi:protein-L-isoaspartate(D-aspartate) O-methyltransferase